MDIEDIIEEAKEIFPGFSQNTQVQLYYFMLFMSKLAKSLSIYKRVIAIAGLIVTILHIYILSRKAMGRSSTNMIMIGLAICDIGLMCITIIGFIQELTNRTQMSCDGPLTYIETYFLIVMLIFENFCRRCTSWLAIMMATIRVIAVKNAKNRSSDYLSHSKCGLHTVGAVLLFSVPFAVFQKFVYRIETENDDWTPPRDCPDTPSSTNTTVFEYITYEDDDLGPYYISINGVVTKIIPCIAFPLLTAVLIIELQKAKKVRKETVAVRNNTMKSDKTTLLVLYMSISFCIAEFPQGVLRLIEFYYFESLGIKYTTMYAGQIFIVVGFINALSHCIVCYEMSIKYRTTFKNMFGCSKTQKPKTSKSSTISVGNVTVTKSDF